MYLRGWMKKRENSFFSVNSGAFTTNYSDWAKTRLPPVGYANDLLKFQFINAIMLNPNFAIFDI
jgi:hypothetical protein